MDARFLAYLVVSAVLIVTPGPDMVLVGRNAIKGGYAAARSTAFGVGTGILLWGVCSAMGLAAALAASAVLFAAIKLAGALFLVGLGLRSLWAAVRANTPPPSASRPAPRGMWGPFVQGVAGNLLNPKAGAIFVAVVPQFIQPADPPARIAAMVGAFVVMVTVWLNGYGFLVARTAGRLGPKIQRTLDAVAGSVMVGLGMRLALEHDSR